MLLFNMLIKKHIHYFTYLVFKNILISLDKIGCLCNCILFSISLPVISLPCHEGMTSVFWLVLFDLHKNLLKHSVSFLIKFCGHLICCGRSFWELCSLTLEVKGYCQVLIFIFPPVNSILRIIQISSTLFS